MADTKVDRTPLGRLRRMAARFDRWYGDDDAGYNEAIGLLAEASDTLPEIIEALVEPADVEAMRRRAEAAEADWQAAVAASTWQAMATAPRDGQPLIVYGVELGHQVYGTAYYFKGIHGDEGWIVRAFWSEPAGYVGTFTPTHWRQGLQPPGADSREAA